MSRHIVKYSNRRLYDPTDGRQITLAELSDLVLSGEDLIVERKDTGADITALTVLQSIIERLRRSPSGRVEAREAERLLAAARFAMERASAPPVLVGARAEEGA